MNVDEFFKQREIINILDRDAIQASHSTLLDLTSVRKICLTLERSINKNREMRTKFGNQPEKFVDSEFELTEAIQGLALLTQDPGKFYPEVVRLGVAISLLGLLAHENVDIAISVIEILEELTDEDILDAHNDDDDGEENQDEGRGQAPEAVMELVNRLIENQLLELLVSTMASRLDEKEEAERNGVFHSLSLIENLISLDPSLSTKLIEKTPLLKFLLTRIRPPKQITKESQLYFQNQQYASEICAILVQTSTQNRKALIDEGGMDVLLEVLSMYRKRDPKDADEVEFMENVFDTLCSVLLEPENKVKFLEGEGVELMVIMMKEKKLARNRSLKVLDHALAGEEGVENCQRFVEHLGLKTLFSAFMGKKNSNKNSSFEDDEHILGIMVSLFFNLESDSAPRLRLLAKFVEDGYEKVDRLLEIREAVEVRLSQRSEVQEVELDETEAYLSRLEAGLFSLQLIDTIIAWICMEDDGVRDHLNMLLKRKGKSFKDVVDVLIEYQESMGDGSKKEGVRCLAEYLAAL
ncbi:Catenin-beta-like protein [Melampsora americana]|nr:Catenin-beta-like protein [Melampsora americana]